MVERWNGMPQVLPPVWLFSMKAGKKLASHFLSSSVLMKSSIGTIASSSISVNMSVESSTEVTGGVPLLCAVSALVMRFLIGAGIDRLHLDRRIGLLEIGRVAVDDLGDRAADRDRIEERDFGRACASAGFASAAAGECRGA